MPAKQPQAQRLSGEIQRVEGNLVFAKSRDGAPLTIKLADNVVVTAVPYLLGKAPRLRDLMAHDELLDPGVTGEISAIPSPSAPVGA